MPERATKPTTPDAAEATAPEGLVGSGGRRFPDAPVKWPLSTAPERIRVAPEQLGQLGEDDDQRVAARSMRVGMWVWPAFAPLDAFMCFVAYPQAPFALFIAYRIVVELAFVAGYRACQRPWRDPRRLFYWQSAIFCMTAFVIALMAVHLGGVRSSYMHGISLVALVWAVLVPSSWRRALPTFLGIGLAFPLVMASVAVVDRSARLEWLTSEALTVFASHYVFVISTSGLGLLLSHIVWSVRQQARRLGSYELEELLGRGGMGDVWRARHHMLARSAAVKVIRAEALGRDAATRARALARFEREARVTASLRSPHTIQLYDFGVSDAGTFYYVMELLCGLDAAELVHRFGPIPPARAIHLLRQVCESLGEAHAAGLVHRDIKPSNIHVCRYGRTVDFVKLLDFGLARPVDGDATHLTGDFAVGTPAFMAPEQVLGVELVDQRSDLYALGCVAYWLLTGQHVFEGSLLKVMADHAAAAPPSPSERLGQAIPADLERLVMTCLEKEPSGRPSSADAVRGALEALSVSHPWTELDARQWWTEHVDP